jgi:DNA end-binding protein Ku
MWSGAISFGLVNIPVKMYKATAAASGKEVSFHQIHTKCGTRLKHIRWCPKDEVEVPWEEVAKGYEFEKGKYVEVTNEELDALLPEEDYATVAIDNFVELAEVDPIAYDRHYYLSPDGSPKAYALLHEVLRSSEKVAVARVLLRTRSHLALVRVLGDHLVLETMFFGNEIVDTAEIPGVPHGKTAHVDKKQLQIAEQLVGSMTTTWDPERYKDDYSAKVKDVIAKKIGGGEIIEAPEVAAAEGGAQVVDLLDALRRSVDATKGLGKKGSLADIAELRPIARVGAARRRHATRKSGARGGGSTRARRTGGKTTRSKRRAS